MNFTNIDLIHPPVRPISLTYRGLPIQMWRVSKKDGAPIFHLDLACGSTGIGLSEEFDEGGGWDYVNAGDFNNPAFQKLLWTELDTFIDTYVDDESNEFFDARLIDYR